MFRHPEEVFQIKALQAQHASLGSDRPHWSYYNIEILKYMKLISTNLQRCDVKILRW